jgi:hypothetical protein
MFILISMSAHTQPWRDGIQEKKGHAFNLYLGLYVKKEEICCSTMTCGSQLICTQRVLSKNKNLHIDK